MDAKEKKGKETESGMPRWQMKKYNGGKLMIEIAKVISNELNVREKQVQMAINLIDEGNTIPFIARYRKEATGGLSDEELRTLGERLNYLRNLESRKEEVKNSINNQGNEQKRIA